MDLNRVEKAGMERSKELEKKIEKLENKWFGSLEEHPQEKEMDTKEMKKLQQRTEKMQESIEDIQKTIKRHQEDQKEFIKFVDENLVLELSTLKHLVLATDTDKSGGSGASGSSLMFEKTLTIKMENCFEKIGEMLKNTAEKVKRVEERVEALENMEIIRKTKKRIKKRQTEELERSKLLTDDQFWSERRKFAEIRNPAKGQEIFNSLGEKPEKDGTEKRDRRNQLAGKELEDDDDDGSIPDPGRKSQKRKEKYHVVGTFTKEKETRKKSRESSMKPNKKEEIQPKREMSIGLEKKEKVKRNQKEIGEDEQREKSKRRVPSKQKARSISNSPDQNEKMGAKAQRFSSDSSQKAKKASQNNSTSFLRQNSKKIKAQTSRVGENSRKSFRTSSASNLKH